MADLDVWVAAAMGEWPSIDNELEQRVESLRLSRLARVWSSSVWCVER
jgi:hypothetical protein